MIEGQGGHSQGGRLPTMKGTYSVRRSEDLILGPSRGLGPPDGGGSARGGVVALARGVPGPAEPGVVDAGRLLDAS